MPLDSPSNEPDRLVELGGLIAAGRAARNLSQSALARQLHVNPSFISMLERGQRRPGDELVVKLEQALGVSLGGMLAHAKKGKLPRAALDPNAPPPWLTTFDGVRRFLTLTSDYEIELFSNAYRVDASGSIHVIQTITGCRPLPGRQVDHVEFYQVLPAAAPPPRIVPLCEPAIRGISQSREADGNRTVYRYDFEKAWERSEEPEDCISLQFFGRIPARSKMTAPPPRKPRVWFDGSLEHECVSPTGLVVISIVFDEDAPAPVEFLAPWGWSGRPPLRPGLRNCGENVACKKIVYKTDHREARLEIHSPLPGFSFGLAWSMISGGGSSHDA